MQLIGEAIRHHVFGPGIVTGRGDGTLTICFAEGEKKFLYPDAFSTYLTLKNTAIQHEIQIMLQKQEEKKRTQQRITLEEQERKSLLQNLKISPNSQIVFHISPAEESTVFSSWTVSTGCYLSGYSKGEPRIPDRMKPNSMCLLTMREEGSPESERRIAGAFMAEENFIGSLCRTGSIQAHPNYRLKMRPDRRPLFWPYLTQDSSAQRWGKTAFKYLSNQSAQRILYDLRALSDGKDNMEPAEEFYQYFCRINRLPPQLAEKE